MIYGSVCSGIEAATVAWHSLGWQPAFFSEIEKFPSAILRHHYNSNMPDDSQEACRPGAKKNNGIPNYGDMTKFEEWPDHAIDLLVGGTPCQSFSIAGLRKGLDDPRGNLMLTYLAIARRYQPRWLVWENVPGVLSSNGGRDFAAFIQGLEECGYHAAWRVLDAQYVRVDGFRKAVPQRRRRIFVVGYLGDWRRAAAVLFEHEGLQGHPAPCRKKGQKAAPTIASRPTGGGGLGTDFDLGGGLIAEKDISGTVSAKWAKGSGGPAGNKCQNLVVTSVVAANHYGNQAVAYDMRGREGGAQLEGPHETANIRAASGGSSRSYIAEKWSVRRLMPVECERLQGFPDCYTNIPWKNGKYLPDGSNDEQIAHGIAVQDLKHTECPDGPRYKALGNSMAVNVMRWIGQRIEMVDSIK